MEGVLLRWDAGAVGLRCISKHGGQCRRLPLRGALIEEGVAGRHDFLAKAIQALLGC